MAAPIDFYFDFSSPYGYLAAERIEALAERLTARSTGTRCSSASCSSRPAPRR